MSLRTLAQAPPSPEAWSALVAALDRKKPRASHASGLSRLLRDWPAWTRIFPAAWFARLEARAA